MILLAGENYRPSGQYKEKLEKKLPLAGENRGEIEKFLLGVKEDHRPAAEFLIAHMSGEDLAAIDAAALDENIEYAFKARAELAYAKDMPDEMFLHYALPHRATQEPLTKWRKILFEKVVPRVKDCKTLEEAAIELNYWCAEHVTYKSSSRRDQSVFATMNRGFGRCEEEMIFYIYSARSVGIPARACSTPLWPFQDSNHAWVEVWDGKAWRHLGACEPKEVLDRGWFTEPTKRALLMVSTAYGDIETDEPVYRRRTDYTLINSTPAYTGRMRNVKVRVLRNGKPACGQNVYFEIFNFGGIRPLARRRTDEKGETFLDVGIGDFFVMAGDDKGRDFAIVRGRTDKTVELEVSRKRFPEGRFTLSVAPPPPPVLDKTEQPGTEELLRRRIESLKKEKTRALRDRRRLEKRAFHPDLVKDSRLFGKDLEKVRDAFLNAGSNWPALRDAILSVPEEHRDDIIWLIANMTIKDAIEIESLTLLEHILLAADARKEAPWNIDDENYRNHVLQFRIRYEYAASWRRTLRERFSELRAGTIRKTAENVNRWIADNLKKRGGSRLASIPLPTETVRGGGGTEYALAACAVGILRSLGIPSRLPDERHPEWAEFLQDGKWLPLYPLAPDHIGDTSKSEAAKKKYAERGTLFMKFTRHGEPFEGAKFYRDWAVAKYDNGSWDTFYEGIDVQKEEGNVSVELEPGEYLFCAGSRFGDGAPCFDLQHIMIRPGETTRVSAELAIPFGAYKGRGIESPFPGRKRVPDFTCKLLGGGEYLLSERLKEKHQLFITLHPHAEWSKTMIKSLCGIRQKLTDHGIEVIGICPVKNQEAAEKCASDLGAEFPVIHDPDGEKTNPWIGAREKSEYPTALPVVTLVRKNGTIVFQTIRNEPAIADLAIAAARTLKATEEK
jgi:transglutaminase-like putative cysteine protease